MNYKVLYRKYRPTNFENILGQDYIIKTLKNSIKSNSISHAYIFSGPRGTGKTSTAKIFSKAINCLSNVNGSPCENCGFCNNAGENPDIIEIDAASNNGVDQIRELIDNIKLTPTNGKYKVYIIDEVHMLTTSAFNALLLTLEEPPAHAIFILATTNIENVPITILSRCQRFDFQKITIENLVNGLKNVCDKEKIEITDDALTEIAYLSEGGMRDALSLLDQLSKNNALIDLEMVETQIKTISQKGINELLSSIEDNSVENCLNHINDYRLRAVDYKTLIKKIIDISSLKAKNIKRSGRYDRLKFEDYKELIIKLSNCLTSININVDPYTILEMILLEFLDVEVNSNNTDVFNNINITSDINREESKTSDVDLNVINIRINNCFVNAQKKYLEEAKQIFSNIPTHVNGKIRSILIDCQVVAASDEYVILTCLTDHTALNANKLLNEIEYLIKNEFHKNYKIVFISTERWNREKNEYVKNIKNNKKYEYIPEITAQDQEELIVNNIFDISKVEII